MGIRLALASTVIALGGSGAVAASAAPALQPLTPEDVMALPHAEVERRLPVSHPSDYFIYSGRLVGENQRDPAIRWFYVGELRYRFRLEVTHASGGGDDALYASLHESVGSIVNAQAGADPDNWIRQIDAALGWDERHDNAVTSRTGHAAEWQATRAGLAKLRTYIDTHRDELKRGREASGIGEVGLVDGVYVEEHRPPMPVDWPALAPASTLASIAGTYVVDPDVVQSLASEVNGGLRAKTLELVAVPGSRLTLVLRDGAREIGRAMLAVQEASAAVEIVRATDAPDEAGQVQHVRERIGLQRNVAGDLVVRREVHLEGTIPGKQTPQRLTLVAWSRAAETAR